MKKLIVLVVLVFALAAACGETVVVTPGGGDTLGSGGGGRPLDFPISLEEIAVEADVVARVNLLRVSTSTDIWWMDYREGLEREAAYPGPNVTRYVGTLDYRFRVVEYLKGTGDSEIVARVNDLDPYYGHPTREEAQANADALLADRDDSWDRHEAIVFLRGHNEFTSFPLAAGEYDLGYVVSEEGTDGYTIDSPDRKKWLPAVTRSGSGGVSGQAGTNPSYYLDAPGGGAGGASGQSGSIPTITLTDMKPKVAALEHEVAAGDGSEAYRECVLYKYQHRRHTDWRIETKGDGSYPYKTYPAEIGSGLPAGTEVLKQPHEYLAQLVAAGETLSGYLQLLGDDADLFTAPLSEGGHVSTTRPLPAGEYRFFYFYRGDHIVPCNGHPVEWERDDEVILTVTAPEGTLREALFDPATIGSWDGYISSGDLSTGDLSPAAFSTSATTSTGDATSTSDTTTTGDATTTTGDSTTINSLYGTGDSVTMTLSPYNNLAGHTLDFITGDGTTILSLTGATGDATAGTLTWAVGSQPWSSGDELMHRITEPWFGVRVALSPRQGERQTYTDITISWADPQTCGSQYFVGLYQGDTPVRIWGYHPATPTGITRNTGLTWGSNPINTWTARVHCGDDDWRLVGDVPLTSGLP